jgi:hypothetical protein
VALAGIGLGISISLFLLAANYINGSFGGDLKAGERFCQIDWHTGEAVSAAVMLVAILASGLAGLCVCGLEPGEAIRDE